jgi:enamine deaminase RidA (YjgF/YER057c/UK114 family)
MRTTFTSGDPRDARIGYSKAVRVGTLVFLSGHTAPADDAGVIPGGLVEQFRQAIDAVGTTLTQAGAAFSDVVRNTVFVNSAAASDEGLEALAYAHGDIFSGIDPALTIVVVAELPGGPLIEIETTAVVGTDQSSSGDES